MFHSYFFRINNCVIYIVIFNSVFITIQQFISSFERVIERSRELFNNNSFSLYFPFFLRINNQKLVVSVGPLLAKVSSNLLKGNKINHSYLFFVVLLLLLLLLLLLMLPASRPVVSYFTHTHLSRHWIKYDKGYYTYLWLFYYSLSRAVFLIVFNPLTGALITISD